MAEVANECCQSGVRKGNLVEEDRAEPEERYAQGVIVKDRDAGEQKSQENKVDGDIRQRHGHHP